MSEQKNFRDLAITLIHEENPSWTNGDGVLQGQLASVVQGAYQAGRADAMQWRPMLEAKIGDRVLLKYRNGLPDIGVVTAWIVGAAAGWMEIPK